VMTDNQLERLAPLNHSRIAVYRQLSTTRSVDGMDSVLTDCLAIKESLL